MTTFLILGGTGKTGRRAAAHLTALGHTPRTAARSGADVRFDWDDPVTYRPALEGTGGVYVIPPALRLDHPPLLGAFAAEAVAAGVDKLVLLSARGANLAPQSPLAQAEAAVRAVAPDAVIVRPAWFMQNFTEAFFRAPIDAEDTIVAPAGDGAEPFVDADDIAAVVAAALTDERLAGAELDLTGPEALSFAHVASILSGAAGRPLRHVDPGPDAWRDGAVAAGVPEPYAALLAGLFGVIRDGHGATLSDGVQRALGREPGTFAAWARREAGVLARAEVPA